MKCFLIDGGPKRELIGLTFLFVFASRVWLLYWRKTCRDGTIPNAVRTAFYKMRSEVRRYKVGTRIKLLDFIDTALQRSGGTERQKQEEELDAVGNLFLSNGHVVVGGSP